ncbi:ACT domain-containing protein [Parabacteroides faecis]|uniref:ACT domain-containing protein n=1 Tax=Parabacteroides TaxID=375288 RepID=UPI000EFFD71C|nr:MULTISPECIES: ACT domain-containing protein [Parabacteroides]MBC8617234.1 ACT domain-containing protein [Parabacteroides faecis]RHS01173.1 ACT domain-containing protein [Parabacteroides sp. AF14-59]UVQ47645.1 ACT domain-containing protein [Parabacteroides faecis]
MTGIKELQTLLANVDPVLDERSFIFCTFPELNNDDICRLNPIGFFHEKEGLTLIITKQQAVDSHINYESVYSLISLNVHSSLDAVGLTAAFSAKLAEKNISANVVAAYYHDHIFVPEEKATQALMAIHELQ